MTATETPVCPHCIRPFEPGADYCTHCGGGLGTAETQLPYLPIPNAARFSERHEPAPHVPRRSWVHAVAVFWVVWLLTGWLLFAVFTAVGTGLDGFGDGDLFAYIAVTLGAFVAALYSYRRSRRRRASS